MIESISISGVATYPPTPIVLANLSVFNYFYGSNGSGKTTLSRVIANSATFPGCAIKWTTATPLETMVYNKDFVDRNFNQAEDLKGVFTLGENQVETRRRIDNALAERELLVGKINNYTASLSGHDGKGGKRAELATLEKDFSEAAWRLKLRMDEKRARAAFQGSMGSKDNFKSRVLRESLTNNSTLLSLDEIERKGETAFSSVQTVEPLLPTFEVYDLIQHESNPILTKRVIGKSDVDIAAMIHKLGNSDWVREGRQYFAENEGVCPFCQQEVVASFDKSLSEYFDERFTADSAAISTLATDYARHAEACQQAISNLIETPGRFLATEPLKAQQMLLNALLARNAQHLLVKQTEPSQTCTLEPLSPVLNEIQNLILRANNDACAHNAIVNNIEDERTVLSGQVWKYVLEELRIDLGTFQQKKQGLERAIASMEEEIRKAQEQKAEKDAHIRVLEIQITTVQPTIDEINALLRSFGFVGFKIAKGDDGRSYKLLRNNGQSAKESLSEGEKTFLTFLYFFHLIKGSDNESGLTGNRVVVFDDPVSSLDSEILFIVASLLKSLFDEVRSPESRLKQIFVLTHNVYFHKEVTHNGRRTGTRAMTTEETFWIVRKQGLHTSIDRHEENPVKTSYDLLWGELRRTPRSNGTIQNVLRRILEHYFKLHGGVDLPDFENYFEGRDKIFCRSLVSWVHDGSHYVHDDLYVTIDDIMVENYLRVFRAIFRNTGSFGHYKLMMGSAYVAMPEDSES